MKFTEQDLRNKLNATDEQVELVLAYQETFPMLITSDTYVSGRDLHEGLSVHWSFTEWIKKQIELASANETDYRVVWLENDHSFKQIVKQNKITNVNDSNIDDLFKQTVEFNGNANSMTRNGYYQDYILTTELAKEICMGVGFAPRTNAETKAKSKIARKYFITMESMIKDLISWQKVREKEKENYLFYQECFMDYLKRQGIEPSGIYYACSGDILNLMAIGMGAKEFKKWKEVNSTRDNLIEECNKRISFVQDNLVTLYQTDTDICDIFDILFKIIKREFNVDYKEIFITEMNRKYHSIITL